MQMYTPPPSPGAVPSYQFDPSGRLPANKITGEQQILTVANYRDYHFIVPKLGPYFSESLQVTFKAIDGSIRTLVEGVDYYATHWFIAASRACSAPIYGSISFLDVQLAGVVTLQYQTLGGIWVQDDAAIAQILADRIHNPRTTSWDVVVNMPVTFPVIDHEWDLVDMVGMKDIVTSLGGVEDAIRTRITSDMSSHINNLQNPHQTTAAQIGAATVNGLNTAIAQVRQEIASSTQNLSTDQIQEGSNNLFFTLRRVWDTVLTGLDLTTKATITATDTVLSALGKLQAQVSLKADKANPAFTGYLSEAVVQVNATAATTTLDLSTGSVFQSTIGANSGFTFDFSKITNGAGKSIGFSLTTINDGTAGRAISFPANVKWAGGTIPPRTTAALARDDWYFYTNDNGVTFAGSLANQDVK